MYKQQYDKFYELDIWKEGYELQKEIFELTIMYSKQERYGLVCQTNDSSNSVIANIAESHGRYHYGQKIMSLYVSRGEIEETQSHLLTAVSRGYVTKEKATELVSRYEKLKIKLNNYIADLWKRRDN